MVNKERVGKVVLVGILALGFFLRLYKLGEYPSGFHSQEAIVGYRSYSLLNTGKDELGRPWPLFFSSFGDYQLPFPTYLTMATVGIFGLTEGAVRLPMAIFGGLAVLALYGIVRKLYPEKYGLPLWTAFFMAIVPWGVFFSRIAFPEGLSLFLFLLGLNFSLALKEENGQLDLKILLAAFFFIAATYTAKISWTITFVVLAILFVKGQDFELSRKKTKYLLLIVFLFFFPLFVSYLRLSAAKQSFLDNDFNFIKDVSISNGINSMRGNELKAGNPMLGKLFFNKGFYGVVFAEKYLGHFSPSFYFAKGEQNPLHGLWNFGPFYLVLIFPAVFGLWHFSKSRKKARDYLLIVWFCLAIVPSALVWKSPDQARLIFALPVLVILCALGINYFPKKILRIILFAALSFNVLFVFYDAIYKEPVRGQRDWYYGFKKVSRLLETLNYQNYTKVYLTDGLAPDPLPLFLFFSKYPPLKFQEESSSLSAFNYRSWLSQLSNVHVGRLNELMIQPGEKVLFVVTPQEEKSLLSRFVTVSPAVRLSGLSCYKINDEIKGKDGSSLLLVAVSLYDNCRLLEEK